jgi:hypothetical protein
MQTANQASGSNVLEQLSSGAVVMFQAETTYLSITVFNGATILTWVTEQSQAIPFVLKNYTYSADHQTAVAEITVTMDGGDMYLTPMKPEVNGLPNPVLVLPNPAQVKMMLTSDPTQQVVNLQATDGSMFTYSNNPVNYITLGQNAQAVGFTVLVLKS